MLTSRASPAPPARRIFSTRSGRVLLAVAAVVTGARSSAVAVAQALPPAPDSPSSVALPVESGEAAAIPHPIEIHGFASQGYILTTGNDYIAADSKHGSFQLSEVGINFTKQVSDNWRWGAQAFAQNLGMGGNFNLKADWFYLDYLWRDWLGLRFGRLKIPFGIYNDVNDIDSARGPILLPQSLYPLQGRSFLFAQTGVELYGFARSRVAGALDYRLYVGTIFIDPAILNPPGSGVDLQLNVRYVAGGRLFWETPVPRLRIGASLLAVQLDVTAFAGGMVIPIKNRSVLGVGSAEYGWGGLMLTAEYSRWHTVQESSDPGSDPPPFTQERAYVMASYRLTPWLQPTAYYALFFPDVTQRGDGPGNRQDDVSLTLRFDVTTYWVVKLEGHYMSGTAGVGSPLMVGPAPVALEPHWGAFLLKTTGYF